MEFKVKVKVKVKCPKVTFSDPALSKSRPCKSVNCARRFLADVSFWFEIRYNFSVGCGCFWKWFTLGFNAVCGCFGEWLWIRSGGSCWQITHTHHWGVELHWEGFLFCTSVNFTALLTTLHLMHTCAHCTHCMMHTPTGWRDSNCCHWMRCAQLGIAIQCI